MNENIYAKANQHEHLYKIYHAVLNSLISMWPISYMRLYINHLYKAHSLSLAQTWLMDAPGLLEASIEIEYIACNQNFGNISCKQMMCCPFMNQHFRFGLMQKVYCKAHFVTHGEFYVIVKQRVTIYQGQLTGILSFSSNVMHHEISSHYHQYLKICIRHTQLQ